MIPALPYLTHLTTIGGARGGTARGGSQDGGRAEGARSADEGVAVRVSCYIALLYAYTCRQAGTQARKSQERTTHTTNLHPISFNREAQDAQLTMESELKTLKRALEDAKSQGEQLAELAQVRGG